MKKAKDQPESEPAELASLVGERIRKIRKEEGLSLELFALRCDMNAAYVGHIERGVQNPTLNTLERIEVYIFLGYNQHIPQKLYAETEKTAELMDNVSKLYEELISFSDLYDSASFEAKKIIVNQLIRRVDVYRGYQLNITFNFDLTPYIERDDAAAC